MNNYEKQAKDFLEATNTKFKYELVGEYLGFPNEIEEKKFWRYQYKATLKNSKGQFSVNFYDSHQKWLDNDQDISEYDLLASFNVCVYDESEDVWEYAENYGFEINSKEDYETLKKSFKETKRIQKALKKLFDESQLEALSEIY